MSLRLAEDRKRFTFYEMPARKRQQILSEIRELLADRPEIKLALAYGGFTKRPVFRDIDVAVYTEFRIPYTKSLEYEEELSKTLEKQVGIPVDIKLLDYMPTWLKLKALNGTLLLEREFMLRARLKFKARQELQDINTKLTRLKAAKHIQQAIEADKHPSRE